MFYPNVISFRQILSDKNPNFNDVDAKNNCFINTASHAGLPIRGANFRAAAHASSCTCGFAIYAADSQANASDHAGCKGNSTAGHYENG
jgi:hypothetical protein